MTRTHHRPSRPARERDDRRTHGVASRRPRFELTWRGGMRGVALLVAAAVFLVPAGLLVRKAGSDAAAAAQQSAAYVVPPLPDLSALVHTGPVLAFVGDETVEGAASGVPAAMRWPALLGDDLRSDITVVPVVDGGFATRGRDGSTFASAAADIPSDADVVLLVGGSHDASASASSVARAAMQAVAAVKQQASGATVAMVGPLITSDLGATALARLRSTLATAARDAGVQWVDPVGWTASPRGEETDLTAADERAIAAKLRGIVQRLAR